MDFKHCFAMNTLLCRVSIGEEKVNWDWESTQGQQDDGKGRSLSSLLRSPGIPCALLLFPLPSL